MFAVKDNASNQNTRQRSSRGSMPEWCVRDEARDAVPADDGSSRKWSGAQSNKFAAPSTPIDSRHPNELTSHCVTGQNTVLANPAVSVSAVMPLRASAPKVA